MAEKNVCEWKQYTVFKITKYRLFYVLYQSFVRLGYIAGPRCQVLTSESSPQCCKSMGLLIPCPNRLGNFTFICQDLSRALTIKMSPHTQALKKRKTDIPAIPQPHTGHGYKWLVHKLDNPSNRLTTKSFVFDSPKLFKVRTFSTEIFCEEAAIYRL